AEFDRDLRVPGTASEFNQTLEHALRVEEYFELAELMCRDALMRAESCGAHFREEFQTPDGEAFRDDENFSYVAAWEYQGRSKPPALHKEQLEYEEVEMTQRSYK
ncbi:MAG: fumarate reductase/succinate dehydrogenase flavoprotein subunit, partial [Verrucomicrobia bacterium]|nr:fumarate reductase/succinate dehydrogenase flavoprotein subunit [Verrucomicrobiota bacterium]